MTQLFRGAGVALITPFKTDYTIDYNRLEKLVDDQISAGMDYLVALGTTAETPTLSATEKKEVVACIRSRINRRVPLLVGMGGNDPARVIKMIRETDFDGINGILSVTPYYNKPSQEGLETYFREIARFSPVPVVLYNVPSRTGVNMLGETTLRLAGACPSVVAVKEAAGDLGQAAAIIREAPEHFALISGDDALTLPLMALGSSGVISVAANAVPGHMAELVHMASEGNFVQARKIHLQLSRLFRLLFREGNPAGIKALMEITGKASNTVRLPLTPVSRELYGAMEKEMEQIEAR
ncbi:MAG: 4-hydroxy-tetrahydrodipicolinate synthase [Mangrovibacterium sp.]